MLLYGPPDFIIKAIWILLTILIFLTIYYLINIGNNYVNKKKQINITNKNIGFILLSLIIAYSLYKFFNRYTFLYDIFITVIASIIIAYAINPLINKLEKKNINRLEGVLIVYISIVAVFLILAFLVIPKSGRELKRLVNDLPKYFEELSRLFDGIYTRYYSTLGDLPPIFQGIETAVMDNIVNLEIFISNALRGFVAGVIGMASKVVSIILTPILTLYFLVDKNYFKEKIIKMIPDRYRKDVLKLSNSIDFSISQFIKGRLIMSLYVGVATTIMLFILGIDFAIVIGFITGLFDIVPYIGPLMGFIPAVFFAFISKPIKAIWVSIFFIFIQWAENNILGPKIIGENMGMHPMVILLSIIVGGGIFGVFGMFISVPIVAISKIIFLYIRENKREELG